MKRILKISAIIAVLVVYFLYDSSSSSPVGTYSADLTIVQSGVLTTIVLNEDGTATMKQDNYETEYGYWGETGKGMNVYIKIKGHDLRWYMNFDKKRIYYGAENYRSDRNGYTFKKID